MDFYAPIWEWMQQWLLPWMINEILSSRTLSLSLFLYYTESGNSFETAKQLK